MKISHRNRAPKRQRTSNLVALSSSNKQNLEYRLQSDRILSQELGRQSHSPPMTYRMLKQNRYNEQYVLPSITSIQTISTNQFKRHSRISSVQLAPVLPNKGIQYKRLPFIKKTATLKVDLSRSQLDKRRVLNRPNLLPNQQHNLSIDQEFTKLESLTRHCSHLHRDLVSVQSDLMTLRIMSLMQDASTS